MPAPRRARRFASARAALLLLLAGTALLAGCAPVHDGRTYDAFIEDQQIELAAMRALINDPRVARTSRISATSHNRKVLLTGQADTDEVAERAASLVSRLPKVQRVIDEIVVGPRASLARETEDRELTARVKADLTDLAVPGFDPARVKVVTEDGVVYLMGLVSIAEAAAVTEEVRYVPGVERVVKLFEYVEGG